MDRAVTKIGIGYARQSIENDPGIERQTEDITAHAAARGVELIGIESDNDISGYSGKVRKGYERLLRRLAEDGVNYLFATELQRLTREAPQKRLQLLELCAKQKIIISIVRGLEADPSTPTGYMILEQLMSIARYESALKSERQVRSIQQAVKQGRRVSGRRPFGYDDDGKTIRDDEAAAVRAAFDDFLSGVPFVDIARSWNAAGFRTGQRARTGERAGEFNEWTGDTVRGVLKNPRYAGFRGHTPEPERGRRKHQTEGLPRAQWPALVSEETWRAVIEKMGSRPGRGAGQLGTPRMLLTGIATCGVCGSGVWGSRTTQGLAAYRCRGSSGHFMRRAEPVDEWVSEVMIARLSRDDAAELLVDDTRPDADELRSKRLALQSRLDGLAELLADGTLTAAQVRSAADRLRAELAAVEAEQAHAGRADVLGPLVRAEDVRAAWDALSVGRRRAVVEALATVTLLPVGRGTRTFQLETVVIAPVD